MVSVSDHPLRIVHAPLRYDATIAEMRRALKLDACSIGWTEAYNRIPFLWRQLRWRLAVGSSSSSRRGPGDVPILVRRHHKLVERYAFKACDRAEPLSLAPERWITGHAYRHPLGTIEHINHHPNPVLNPRATLSMRREYRESMAHLDQRIEKALLAGRLPVVTGDFNLTLTAPFDYAPRQIFDFHNLAYWSVGVDWIAWHRLLVPVRRRLIPRGLEAGGNGQDHPWLIMDFEGFRLEGGDV